MTRVIILAAGKGERWKNFRGTPKHLTTVDGEILLHRTCKQFLARTEDVVVVGHGDGYAVDGTRLVAPEPTSPYLRDLSKFMSSSSEWSDDRTILVFGDVYFTDSAISRIVNDSANIRFFLRKGPSSYTGCQWKEIFGLSFVGDKKVTILEAIGKIAASSAPHSSGGWHLLRELTRDCAPDPFDTDIYINIDDWTEDFDFPSDLVTWEKNRASFVNF